MRFFSSLLLLAGMAGCSGAYVGPPAEEQERAFQITWEQVYGMGRESRPTVTWLSGCEDRAPEGADPLALTAPDFCLKGFVSNRGAVAVDWTGAFSSSLWSQELARYRGYLEGGKDGNFDPVLVEQANNALANYGL